MLAGGFLDPETGDATGRPAGVTTGADGALYVSDDKAGFIYRITQGGVVAAPQASSGAS